MPRIKYYTTRQAAEMLALKDIAVRRLIRQGHIAAANINDGTGHNAQYRISEAELIRFIESRTVQAAS
jgi:excisionase family DNA binding protein